MKAVSTFLFILFVGLTASTSSFAHSGAEEDFVESQGQERQCCLFVDTYRFCRPTLPEMIEVCLRHKSASECDAGRVMCRDRNSAVE